MYGFSENNKQINSKNMNEQTKYVISFVVLSSTSSSSSSTSSYSNLCKLVTPYIEDKKNGVEVCYDSKDNIISETSYVNNKKNGV